jgi:purine-binding chemotaxis protein CheW
VSDTTLYASCRVGDLLVGINVAAVQEVAAGSELTPVPLAPPTVSGLLNLRGSIITAIDLRRCLQLDERPPHQRPVHVILNTADGCMSLLVDDVGDVLEMDAAAFEAPPATLRGRLRELISGAYQVDGGLLLLLNLDGVLHAAAADPLRT